jgi:hypothetical protein
MAGPDEDSEYRSCWRPLTVDQVDFMPGPYVDRRLILWLAKAGIFVADDEDLHIEIDAQKDQVATWFITRSDGTYTKRRPLEFEEVDG